MSKIVRSKSVSKKPSSKSKKEYVIVRASGAGVHAGVLVSRTKDEVTLADARRIWRWDTREDAQKTYTLSDLARTGHAGSGGRISAPVPKIIVLGAHEVITCTAEGERGLRAAPVWQ